MTNEFLEVPDSSGLANAIDRGVRGHVRLPICGHEIPH